MFEFIGSKNDLNNVEQYILNKTVFVKKDSPSDTMTYRIGGNYSASSRGIPVEFEIKIYPSETDQLELATNSLYAAKILEQFMKTKEPCDKEMV